MPLNQLPALLLSILAAAYTPGPANLYAMSCSIQHGIRHSMTMWFGLLCGFITGALITAAIAHAAGIAFAAYIPYVKYVAVAYILYLAWKTYRAGLPDSENTRPTFLSGFIVQLTNAKILLFDLSCYSLFVLPYSNRFIDLLPVAAWLFLAGPGANLVWLLAGHALKPLLASHLKAVSTVMALALVACSVYLFVAH